MSMETASRLPVHVVVCGDRNVLWGIAVAVRSALDHASGPLAITIIGSGLKKDDHEHLKTSWKHPNAASVTIHDLDYDKIKQFRSTKYLKSKVAYARYFIDDFLPNASRCIYLDSDLIVLRDLHEAARIDLEGNTVAAVLDISTRANDGQIALCEKLGITDPSMYFNSGFMVIDLDRYRQDRVQQKLIDISIAMFDRLDTQDQAALNIVLQGKTKLLPALWNTVQYEAHRSFSNGVLHLIGTVKPWHSDYDFKFKDLFFKYLDDTSYARQRPSPFTGVKAFQTKLSRATPTRDMITGKLRRILGLAT